MGIELEISGSAVLCATTRASTFFARWTFFLTPIRVGILNVVSFQPTLINKGLGSDVSDVRAAALVVVMKISRSAGALLKPHLGVLIPALLVSALILLFIPSNK